MTYFDLSHSGVVMGDPVSSGGATLDWQVWCDMVWHYEAPSPTCPGEDWLEITEVHEAQIEVMTPGQKSILFYLYDLGSVTDFLALWGVDIEEALNSWEPDTYDD